MPPPLNTTLVVVATNAVLDKAECKRTASAAHAGLARALNPSHTLADGDTVFCLATGAVALDRSTEAARQVEPHYAAERGSRRRPPGHPGRDQQRGGGDNSGGRHLVHTGR